MVRNLVLAAAVASVASLGLASTARAELAYGTTLQGFIVSFDTAAPGDILSSFALQGLGQNESFVGIDIRPATGQLFGIGSFGNVYTVNPNTGVSSLVAPLTNSVGGGQLALNGSNFGVDFNPTVDRIRVVSNADQNLRVNPVTGVTIVDGAISNSGVVADPNVIDVAYTNNNPTATTTTLYGIDAGLGQLVSFISPNAGTIQNVGPLGFDINELGGFDISGTTGIAYAALIRSTESQSRLYRINLATGQALDIGQVGGGSLLTSFTIAAIPEPSALALLAPAALLVARRRK